MLNLSIFYHLIININLIFVLIFRFYVISEILLSILLKMDTEQKDDMVICGISGKYPGNNLNVE